jgi:hypothetical protein
MKPRAMKSTRAALRRLSCRKFDSLRRRPECTPAALGALHCARLDPWRRRNLNRLTLCVLILLARSASLACEDHAYVRAIVDPLPASLSGIRVEAHKTMGAQLVVENRTSKTLEILDADGVAFARVGPFGVEGNIAAPAWYRTYSPAAVVPAEATAGAAIRWVRAASEPSFGWFESRLDSQQVKLAPEVIRARRPLDLGGWSVAVRVDGEPAAIAGRFRYDPPPAGAYVARLTSPTEIARGVRVRLLPGTPTGLLLESAAGSSLVVYGAAGEPFLSFAASGVEANVRSPSWWASGRAVGAPASAADSPATVDWQRVAGAPRFSWIEPRVQASIETATASPGEPVAWEVPMEIDGRRVAVTGEVSWKSATP